MERQRRLLIIRPSGCRERLRASESGHRHTSGEIEVMEPKDAAKPTLDNPAAATGRDGAIDFAAKTAPLDASEPAVLDQSDRFSRVIGTAAIALWADLPRPVQQQLFERALF